MSQDLGEVIRIQQQPKLQNSGDGWAFLSSSSWNPFRQVVPRDAQPSLNEPSFRRKGLSGLSFCLSTGKLFCQC